VAGSTKSISLGGESAVSAEDDVDDVLRILKVAEDDVDDILRNLKVLSPRLVTSFIILPILSHSYLREGWCIE
jgi:hypothetical protein